MLVKNPMIKDAITIDVNSSILEAINRRDPIMEGPSRPGRLKWLSFILITSFLVIPAINVHAMTAEEILEQVNKQSFSDNFRVALSLKAFKGHKLISSHALWLIVKAQQGKVSHFLDFQEPKESKGLRLLFLEQAGQEPTSYMYFPATGKTMALTVDDPPVDVGSTGLTTEDFHAFFSKAQPEKTYQEKKRRAAANVTSSRYPFRKAKGDGGFGSRRIVSWW